MSDYEYIELSDKPRIIVARTDRLGDMALSLPVLASLRAAYPNAYICVLTRKYARDLLLNRADVDEVITFEAQTPHVPPPLFTQLVKVLRKRRFDVGIALFSNFSVGAAFFLGGIPYRIGPKSKLAQIFFNYKIKQRRSKTRRHEADHNLDLLMPLGVAPIRSATITPPNPPLVTFEKSDGAPLVGIHPGSGGSARNWSPQKYAELAKELHDSGCHVVITGSGKEQQLVDTVVQLSERPVKSYINTGGVLELISALSRFDAFVAGSTGPLHIASAVGTPVVGIYCPIFVCLPQRWGPIGQMDTALAPNVPPCPKCVGDKCEHYDCMDMISVALARDATLSKIGSPVDF